MIVRHICRIYSLAFLITMLSGAALASETNDIRPDVKEAAAVVCVKKFSVNILT
jgi:hypothetical protein